MSLRQVVVFGLLLALAFNAAKCSNDEQSNIKVNVVPSLSEYLKENPEAELTPLELVEEATMNDVSPLPSPYMTRTYRIGYRVAGDRLLAQDQAQQSWSRPQDVTKNLYYPQTGIGAVVTYLEVNVNQSTNIGQARIIGGGIGQRQISIVIEARGTLYFGYNAAIYGY